MARKVALLNLAKEVEKTFKTQIKNWAKIDLEKDAELNAQTKNIKSATDKKLAF